MSQENVELVKQLYELWNRGDPGWRHFAPDIEWDVSRYAPDLPSAAHGLDDVRALFRSFLGMWEEIRFEPERFIAHGDRVVVILTVRSRGHRSGIPVADRIAHVFTLRDGLVARHVQYRTPEAAAEAVGLSA